MQLYLNEKNSEEKEDTQKDQTKKPKENAIEDKEDKELRDEVSRINDSLTQWRSI
jgi:hypothetical protein